MPSLKTKRILYIWLVALLAISGFFIFMVWTIIFSNNFFNTKVLEIKEEIKKDKSFSIIKKENEKNDNSVNKLYGYFVKSEETVDFVKKIENLAKSNGLSPEVKSISFSAVQGISLSNMESMDIQFDVVGEWKNVEYFLRVLENYPMYLTINSFSLSKFSDSVVNKKVVPQWIGSFKFSVIKLKDK